MDPLASKGAGLGSSTPTHSSQVAPSFKNICLLNGVEQVSHIIYSIDLALLQKRSYPLFMLCGGPQALEEPSKRRRIYTVQIQDVAADYQNPEMFKAMFSYLEKGENPITPANASAFMEFAQFLKMNELVQEAANQIFKENPNDYKMITKLACLHRHRPSATKLIQETAEVILKKPSPALSVSESFLLEETGKFCDSLILKIQKDTSFKKVLRILNVCSTLQALTLQFDESETDLERISATLNSLALYPVLTSLKEFSIKTCCSDTDRKRGLNLNHLHALAGFLKKQALQLNHLGFESKIEETEEKDLYLAVIEELKNYTHSIKLI